MAGYQYGPISVFGPDNTIPTGSKAVESGSAFIFGSGNTVHSEYGWAWGSSNTVSGNSHTFAFGADNSVLASEGYTIGKNNTLSGSNYCMAIGSGNVCNYITSYAIGLTNVVGIENFPTEEGRATLAVGRSNTIEPDYAFGAGYGHSVSGASTGTMALGLLNIADENSYCSTLLGYGGKSSRYAEVVQASTAFSATGDAQVCHLISKNQTTDATETELFTNGSDKRITIPANTNATFSVLIIARQTNGAGEGGSYKLEGAISNEGGTTSLIGSVTKTVLAEDVAAWDVAATADDTNDALKLTGTGAASDNCNWVAYTTLVQTTG
jgi:hypothetical protein